MQNRVFCSHSLLPFSLSVKLEKIRFVMKCKCDIWYFSCMQVFARFHIVTLSHVHFQWPKISLYFGIFRCRILIKNYLEHFWEKKKKVEIKRKKKKRIYISSLFASRNQGTTSPSAREKRFFRQHCKDVNSYFI